MAEEPAETTIGQRIRRYRLQAGMSLTELANESGVSKSYLSELESSPEAKSPSGEILYRVATVLNVLMSDLLGKVLISDTPNVGVEPSLEEFARLDKVPASDVKMLASIQWRGNQPKSVERWRYIYQAIRLSNRLDDRSD